MKCYQRVCARIFPFINSIYRVRVVSLSTVKWLKLNGLQIFTEKKKFIRNHSHRCHATCLRFAELPEHENLFVLFLVFDCDALAKQTLFDDFIAKGINLRQLRAVKIVVTVK